MKKMLGFALCGSFCTHARCLELLQNLTETYDIIPIVSETAASTDTRFGTALSFLQTVEKETGRAPVQTVEAAEQFGPSHPLDGLLICPCTGNTAAKLAHGITDTAVTMAAKAHLRTDRPLLLALASNDAMAANFCTIGTLLNRKNVYLVPLRQDDIVTKPHSLVADFDRVPAALDAMFAGKQLRPLFL